MKKEKTKKKKTWEFDRKLTNAFELDAKQLGETEKEWIEKAVRQRLKSKKEYQMLGLKLVPLKCRATCLINECKRQLEIGEWAYYGRTGDVICVDCHALRYGDKASVELRMKKLQYEREIKLFRKQIEEYAKTLDLYQVGLKIEETDKRRNELLSLVHDFLRQHIGTPKQDEVIEKMMALDEKLRLQSLDLDGYVTEKLAQLIKKAKKKKAAYAV